MIHNPTKKNGQPSTKDKSVFGKVYSGPREDPIGRETGLKTAHSPKHPEAALKHLQGVHK